MKLQQPDLSMRLVREKSDLGQDDVRRLVRAMDRDGNGLISKNGGCSGGGGGVAVGIVLGSGGGGVIWMLREGGRAMVVLRVREGDVEGRGGSW